MRIETLATRLPQAEYGGKAAQLSQALSAGLPVPPGLALPASFVAAVGAGDPAALAELAHLHATLPGPVAVRSSAVGEDSAEASFAGQHATRLNVRCSTELVQAVQVIWRSACSESARAYRRRLGLPDDPRIAAVVQAQLEPDAAGVLFTRNPMDGSDERVIEAAWGLGEAVVAGLVIPDRYRISRAGAISERVPGSKEVAVRLLPEGSTCEQALLPDLAAQLCLDDAQLHRLHLLAGRCEEVFGDDQDLEWAFERDELYLLQCRPMTRRVPPGAVKKTRG